MNNAARLGMVTVPPIYGFLGDVFFFAHITKDVKNTIDLNTFHHIKNHSIIWDIWNFNEDLTIVNY